MTPITDKQKWFLEKNSIPVRADMTKEEAHTIIDSMKAGTNMPKPSTPAKPKSEYGNNKSFYIGYARDIFVALYDKKSEEDPAVLMDMSIKLVKAAVKSFE